MLSTSCHLRSLVSFVAPIASGIRQVCCEVEDLIVGTVGIAVTGMRVAISSISASVGARESISVSAGVSITVVSTVEPALLDGLVSLLHGFNITLASVVAAAAVVTTVAAVSVSMAITMTIAMAVASATLGTFQLISLLNSFGVTLATVVAVSVSAVSIAMSVTMSMSVAVANSMAVTMTIAMSVTVVAALSHSLIFLGFLGGHDAEGDDSEQCDVFHFG